MGILASWVVWIIFRWQKIPPECHRQRNCQLTMVASSIAITLLFSFAPFVDWGAHLGGAIMGLLLALVLLTDQLDNKAHARIIRIASMAAGSNQTYAFDSHIYRNTEYNNPCQYQITNQ